MASDLSLAIVILAAGGASRFGSTKQLAVYKDKTLLQHAIDACTGIADSTVYVVLGADYKKIKASIDLNLNQAAIINNPEWQEGLSSSIRKAIEQIEKSSDACLFVAADQIQIDSSHIEALAQKWRSNPSCLVAAEFDNVRSIPAVFPKTFYKQLSNLQGDNGGKSILLNNKGILLSMPMDEAKIDIDYKSDLSNLKS